MNNKFNWKTTTILAVSLLLVFVVTRYCLSDYYTPEWSARHIFWVVAIIVLFTSFLDKVKISLSTLTGYLLGMFAGELFGGYQKNVPPHYPHYGWLILLILCFVFCLLGIWLQKRKKQSP